MNPGLLLTLWRERWGKPVGKTLATPYHHGRPNLWGDWLTHLSVWSLTGVTALVSLTCLVSFVFLLSVEFSLNGQIIFSGFLLFLALAAHRYAGTFITLILLGLTVIVSARYLCWRFSTTLPKDMGLAFVLGFCLCAAEAQLWLLMVLRSLENIWPLKQKDMPLPIESGGWPTVDVFIAGHEQPLSNITSAALAASALDWPRKKIQIHILDASRREDVQALADSIAANYLIAPEDSNNQASSINQALAKTSGELIAIIEGDRTPATDLVKMTAGWFIHDAKLAMVQTPWHFLAPPPSTRILKTFDEPDLAGSCSVIRRSALLQVDGIDSEPASKQRHTALKMQAQGYNTAYFSLTARENRASIRKTTSFQQPPPILEGFQVDRPFGDRSLQYRQRLKYLKDMLGFYNLFPRLAFFLAPLVYLLLDVPIVDTSAALFVAYLFPVMVHDHITRQRVEDKDRFTLMTNIRETALAWYLLVVTTLTVTRTEVALGMKALKAHFNGHKTSFDWKIVLPTAAAFGLNLSGLIVGIERLPTLNPNSQGIAVLFLLWTTYNITILAATLAVTEESRAIHRHTRLQLKIPAMIKLPSGHTVSCMTENFPDIALSLKLPARVSIENGATINISLFHAHREFSFPAQVDLEPDMVLRAHIDGKAQNVYRALGVAAYSRGQDWPKWLPSRHADRVYPLWIPQAFVAARVAVRDFALEFGGFVHWLRSGRWMQIWNKKR